MRGFDGIRLISKTWIIDTGVEILEQPFIANENIAICGDCMASEYLATCVLLKKSNEEIAEKALGYVTPVGEREKHITNCFSAVKPYINKS